MGRPRLDRQQVDDVIALALAEDLGPGDVTTAALIDPARAARGRLVARAAGVLAGMPVARRLLERFDRRIRLSRAARDGAALERGTILARLDGPAGPILSVERTLLNFLQQLSGIATATRRCVDLLAGTGVELLDTRKTVPGWRALAKYAVAVGGGRNHRRGLYDQVLIKDNHLAASGLSPAEAVSAARARAPRGLRIEVEVETVRDARAAARAGADIVMLDNMPPARMTRAVRAIRAVRPRTLIEASGRISPRTLRAVAQTGVDRISAGAITHSARALDIALDLEAP